MWAIEFAGKGLIKEHMFVPVEGSPAGGAFTADEPKRFERARCTRATGCSEVRAEPPSAWVSSAPRSNRAHRTSLGPRR